MRAAVPKEQSGGDGSVQRELCVFVPDACNTFPLPHGDFACPPLVEDSSCDCSAPAAASHAAARTGVLAPVGCCQLKSIAQFGGPARQPLNQALAISCFVGFHLLTNILRTVLQEPIHTLGELSCRGHDCLG